MGPNRRQLALRVLALLVVVGVTISLFLMRDWISSLPVVGYPVLFLLSIFANATLILPLPGVALASLMGANPGFSPLGVAVAVGLGAALGEMTGYLAGYSGRQVIERADWYDRILDWMRHYGPLTVLVLSFIPNPLFDLAGIAAGALKMPLYKFLFYCSIGKILKMLMFALFGAQLLQLFPWVMK